MLPAPSGLVKRNAQEIMSRHESAIPDPRNSGSSAFRSSALARQKHEPPATVPAGVISDDFPADFGGCCKEVEMSPRKRK
jgi:hypothetical protein